MFICEICGEVSEPREVCNLVVVETRTKFYPGGSPGIEIVKEIKACRTCRDNSMRR